MRKTCKMFTLNYCTDHLNLNKSMKNLMKSIKTNTFKDI